MDIFNYKCLDKISKTNNDKQNSNYQNIKKYLKNLMYRILIATILFLICSILIKKDNTYKETIYQNVYNKNLSFTKIKSFYDKYLGGILPYNNIINDTKLVFNESLTYKDKSKYLDGVKLAVENNYPVPILQSGIVVFIGEKENYGKTIIIQGIDGIEIWYSNIENENVKLYDYVEEKTLLANTIDDKLILVYTKDGVFLDYEKYF